MRASEITCRAVRCRNGSLVRSLAGWLVAGLAAAWLATAAQAAPVDSGMAVATVRGWLKQARAPLGESLGAEVESVEVCGDGAGHALYHVVRLRPSGFVIVPAEDLVEPIVAFSGQGQFDSSPGNPLGVLVRHDLVGRVRRARAGSMGAARLAHRRKWQELAFSSATASAQPAAADWVSDVRVAPFTQTTWNQLRANNGLACYNYYTPPGEAGATTNYYCGCVATAVAQLMRYFQFPTAGVGTASFTISVDGAPTTRSLRGGNGWGGPYAWSTMPLDPFYPSVAQCQAIGALTADIGVSVGMDYAADGSSASLADAKTALTGAFQYRNAVCGLKPGSGDWAGLTNMINPNLDARLPVLLGISGAPGGHAVVCDGYGYELATLYHHLNLGWGGYDNAWYALPLVDTGAGVTFTTVDTCVYNVYATGTGEIISGRALNESGEPIPQATVTAVRTGGGTYTATTDAQGIYALVKVPSSSQYRLTATAPGWASAQVTCSTGQSRDNGQASGNVSGADFTLAVFHPLIQVSSSAVVAESYAPTNGAVDPGETVTMSFALENAGTSDVADLAVTLLEGGGVAEPSGPQSYGPLAAGGAAAARAFTFTALGSCGGTVQATFQVQDGTLNMGMIAVTIPLGVPAPVFVEDFDGVQAPALPGGWTTARSGVATLWGTSQSASWTSPNSAHCAAAAGLGLNALVSPPMMVGTGATQLSFRSWFNLTGGPGGAGYDGGVLEMRIGSGPFTDVLEAGGSFAGGGYTSTISSLYGNPLAGRRAWSGDSGGFITTVVNVPAAAAGQIIQLRWLCGTDGQNNSAGAGWFIDEVEATSYWCGPGAPPSLLFVPSADSYSGLFQESGGVEFLRSGAVGIKTTSRGTYSGSLRTGTGRYAFNGRFDFSGRATNTIARGGASPLTVVLQMDVLDNGRINGTVSDGTWVADLAADRAVFKAHANPAPFAGKYTLVLPGTGDAGNTGSPQGDGFGSLTVSSSGLVQFHGVLADGTPLMQATTLSETGQWPVYASLYGGKGQVFGWLTFTNTGEGDLCGVMNWLKLAGTKTRYYPEGFAVEMNTVGSVYRPDLMAASLELNPEESVVVLMGGNLAASITNSVTVSSGGSGSKWNSDTARLTLLGSGGVFIGGVRDPATGKRIGFRGAMLQKQAVGLGFFLGRDQSGQVLVVR